MPPDKPYYHNSNPYRLCSFVSRNWFRRMDIGVPDYYAFNVASALFCHCFDVAHFGETKELVGTWDALMEDRAGHAAPAPEEHYRIGLHILVDAGFLVALPGNKYRAVTIAADWPKKYQKAA